MLSTLPSGFTSGRKSSNLSPMISLVRSLWDARNLLLNLVRRDLTVRYKSTVLGFFWSFAKPLAYMVIYQVVFGGVLEIEIRQKGIPYALHVLAGVLPWTFFIGATGEAMNSILASANLVKKVKLPLAVFPAAAVCSHAVHFALAMVVLVGVMIFFGLPPGPLFLLVPAVAALQILLIMAVSLALSSLNVFYRDVASIWEVIGAAWFYATPIIYPSYNAAAYFHRKGLDWAYWLYLANPMASITLAYRRLMLYGALGGAGEAGAPLELEIPDGQLLASLGLALALSLAGLWLAKGLFGRLSRRLADEL